MPYWLRGEKSPPPPDESEWSMIISNERASSGENLAPLTDEVGELCRKLYELNWKISELNSEASLVKDHIRRGLGEHVGMFGEEESLLAHVTNKPSKAGVKSLRLKWRKK